MSIERFVRDRALVFLSKNKDYGDSMYESMKVFPDAGKVRILDKVNRLKSLLKRNGEHEVDESMEDTVLDLFNYVVMHEVIEQEKYYLYYIVDKMVEFAEFPCEVTDYVNQLLTVADTFLGLDEFESSYVQRVINDLIVGG